MKNKIKLLLAQIDNRRLARQVVLLVLVLSAAVGLLHSGGQPVALAGTLKGESDFLENNRLETANMQSGVLNNKQVVRVGWNEMKGFQEYDAKGKPCGYYYDYLRTVAYYTGITYEFVPGSWQECIERLENGSIDLMVGMNRTPARELIYDFSNAQIGTEVTCLYVPVDNNKYHYESFKDFKGMRIAVAANSYDEQALRKYAEESGFNYVAIPCHSWDEANSKVQKGQADALVSANTEAYEGYKVVGEFSPMPQYFAVKKGNNKVITAINYGMLQLASFYPHFNSVQDSNPAHFTRPKLTFTKDEKAFINKQQKITMLCGDSWYPFEYYDKESQSFKGIAIEVMKEVAAISGLNIEFALDTGNAMYKFIEEGQPYTMTGMSYSQRLAEDSRVVQTQPYAMVHVLRIQKDMQTVPETVATLPKGYMKESLQKLYPNLKLIEYNTVTECLEAVRSGGADCTFVNAYEADYYLSVSKFQSLKRINVNSFNQNMCFGIADSSDPIVLIIISKAIASISNQRMAEIISRNASGPAENGLVVLAYTQPFLLMGILSLFLIGVVFMLFLYYRSKADRANMLALERAKQAQTDFFSSLSHDIRTPMNVIIGMTQFAKENENPQSTNEYLDKIETASNFLLGLVNDVLAMAKVESGTVQLHYEPYSVKEFGQYLDAIARPLCQQRGLKFISNYDKIGDLTVMMDRLHVNKVFFNLISNAAKFTPEGGTVSVMLQMEKYTDRQVYLAAVVQDTGIGMSREFQKRLFDAFSQEEQTPQHLSQGSGLGMSIVKQLLDLMDCTIEVQSELGKGTTYTIKGKFEKVEPLTHGSAKSGIANGQFGAVRELYYKDPAAGNILQGLHILVCEDHPLNQQIITRILQKEGMVVTMVDNGKLGLEEFSSSAVGEYKAVLMDIRMPVMDGLAATKAIRSQDRADAKTVPVIAMTANAFAEDVDNCLKAGMDAHLAKPVDRKLLYDTIVKFVAKN